MTEVHRALLRTLCDIRVCDVGAISQQLGLSEALIEGLIGELSDRGYLVRTEYFRDAQCRGCRRAGTCDFLPCSDGWTVTEQGMAAVGQLRD